MVIRLSGRVRLGRLEYWRAVSLCWLVVCGVDVVSAGAVSNLLCGSVLIGVVLVFWWCGWVGL